MRFSYLLFGAATTLCLSALWLTRAPSKQDPLPELLQGLPEDQAAADVTFGARVIGRFAIGTTLQDVVSALENDGFRISADGKSAGFAQAGLVCSRNWRIFWNTDEAQSIRGISGSYAGTVCL